jgi:hypothetical protein
MVRELQPRYGRVMLVRRGNVHRGENMSLIIWRETHSSDKMLINKFIDQAHADFQSGTVDYKQFRSWITHMICKANNLGIDRTLEYMQTELEKGEAINLETPDIER